MAVGFDYPISLAKATPTDHVQGFMSPYAFDPTTPSLVSVLPTVSSSTPSSGSIAITVDAIQLPPPSTAIEPEPGFVVTFNPMDSKSTLFATNPLDDPLNVLPSPCTNCLRTVKATAFVNGVASVDVTFTYLDPTSVSFPLTYSALGLWTKPTTVSGSSPWTQVGGAFSAGVITRGLDLPTTGSADYQGYFIGRYATSVAVPADQAGNPAYSLGTYIVGANAAASANFTTQSVTFSTSNTQIAPESGGFAFAETRLDLTSTTMPIIGAGVSTTNSFGGTVTTSSGLTGPIQGGFYGQPATTKPFAPPEAGGSVSVTNGSTQSMVGGFALKKTP